MTFIRSPCPQQSELIANSSPSAATAERRALPPGRSKRISCSLQPAEIDSRRVFHAHAALHGMGTKNLSESLHHRSKIRIVRQRRIGAAAKPPRQLLETEFLKVRQFPRNELVPLKKAPNVLPAGVGLLHATIVRPEVHEKVLVFPRERRSIQIAFVPNHHAPSLGPQDSRKLLARGNRVEPMKRLAGRDEIDCGAGQRSGFGRAIDTQEIGERGEKLFARGAHVRIRLDAKNAVAVLEKEFGKKARAGTDVRNDVLSTQTAFLAQQIQQRRGIARAVAGVVGYAGGKALFGVGESQERNSKPENRNRYGNCFRKRMSFWKNTWRSSMPYLSIARRSMPMPNAKPLTFLGS